MPNNNEKKAPSPRKIKYVAMEQIFQNAGYQVWQCHLTRIHLLGVVFIAVNQIAAAKRLHPYAVWRTLCTIFLQTLKGTHFSPDRVRQIWALVQREGEGEDGDVKEIAPWLSGAVERGEECPLCGAPMETDPELLSGLLGMEVPAKVTPPDHV